MANCRVWVGNLAPGLPRTSLVSELANLSIAPRDFALFHKNFPRASSAILAYDTQVEVDEAILVLNGARLSVAISNSTIIARVAEDAGDREHSVIRLRKAPPVHPPPDAAPARPPARPPPDAAPARPPAPNEVPVLPLNHPWAAVNPQPRPAHQKAEAPVLPRPVFPPVPPAWIYGDLAQPAARASCPPVLLHMPPAQMAPACPPPPPPPPAPPRKTAPYERGQPRCILRHKSDPPVPDAATWRPVLTPEWRSTFPWRAEEQRRIAAQVF